MGTTKPYFLEILPPPKELCGYLLAAHGLNQNPRSMAKFLEKFSSKGIQCYLLHLPGHLDPGKAQEELTQETYWEAFRNSYEEVCRKNSKKWPFYFLGYSFGGLIGVSQLNECFFDKVVLMAPAIRVRKFVPALKIILPFLEKVKSVPLGKGQWEEACRFHKGGVPKKIYTCFFKIYDQFLKIDNQQQVFKNVPGLVVCHPRDELISYSQLKKWVQGSTSWDFIDASEFENVNSLYRHLLYYEPVQGPSAMEAMYKLIFTFLDSAR